MFTSLMVGWTVVMWCPHLTAASVRTRFPVHSRWTPQKCKIFIPPPAPPPMFPSVKRKDELLVDITEHITGPKGEKGCRGVRGHRGKPGVSGPEGEQGPQGPLGRIGPKGDKGERGWRGLYGDIGTPGMIRGVKGRKGFRGEKGAKGHRGQTGEKGVRGFTGRPGEKGDPGLNGNLGRRGGPGPRGETGHRGAVGVKGSLGPPGNTGHAGTAGLHGQPGVAGHPGQVYVLPGRQGDHGEAGPSAQCNCSHPLLLPPLHPNTINNIFVASGEKQMRRLRAENVMVLRTDRKALYIYSNSQWINILEDPRDRL